MRRQTQQTHPYVIIGPRHPPHVLPSLCGWIIAMDCLRVSVVFMAVATKNIKLPLQNSTSCPYMWLWQRRDGSPGVGHWVVHLTIEVVREGWAFSHGDPACHIETMAKDLHAVMGSAFSHICQIRVSSLWVIQNHG